ncbi:MAG: hypothetical protein AAF368_16630, partial [Planctomycetota bacterium]
MVCTGISSGRIACAGGLNAPSVVTGRNLGSRAVCAGQRPPDPKDGDHKRYLQKVGARHPSPPLGQGRDAGFPPDRSDEEAQTVLIVKPLAQVEPLETLKEKRHSGGVGAGEQHGNHNPLGLVGGPVEKGLDLLLLPRPHFAATKEDDQSTTRQERLLQRIRPRLTNRDIAPIEEKPKLMLFQIASDLFHRA